MIEAGVAWAHCKSQIHSENPSNLSTIVFAAARARIVWASMHGSLVLGCTASATLTELVEQQALM